MAKIIHGRINKTSVTRLKPGQTIRDMELKGFGARRQKSAASYFLQKKINGRVRWFTIGRHGEPWTPELARREALRLLRELAAGDEPGQQKTAEPEKPTLREAAALFLAEHGPKLSARTRAEYERLIRLEICPELGSKHICDITRAQVSRFHSGRGDRPALANFSLAVLSKLFTWAEENGYRPDATNPCRGTKKFRRNVRERYLTISEFARLGAVLDSLDRDGRTSPLIIAAIRLLLFTGARLNEILTLKWSFVDRERRLLLLPTSKTGAKAITLNDAALTVLQNLQPRPGNPYVIAGHRRGGHLVNLQKPWRRIRAMAALDDVRLHDLRHTYASVAAASGASLPMIGKLLGHANTETTARYAHLADEPIQLLNEDIGNRIAAAMTLPVDPDATGD